MGYGSNNNIIWGITYHFKKNGLPVDKMTPSFPFCAYACPCICSLP
ncbi:hypothetical protein HMPREF9442_02178 [Paraprevotella xylaniphila YIT 11841]|uniref:Uncharacterized protein n=1 Tax=Paraprevotella xylaniphila YIT 11841 TaxID=762982 RepID=F3QVF2_9BACT|nr:hypothetical protein HMPREF9442_02178 [Paraprevotella xylaniphila YIT 11841]